MGAEAEEVPDEELTSGEENNSTESEGDIQQKEAEIARLAAEVERLRSSMIGAAEVIEELENPPMPPIVEEDVVIGAHTVADIARMARQLDRDELVRASMGAIAMLHPESPEVLISTKHSAMLPRMNEKDICAGKLGGKAPRGAPEDWRVLEVLLASASLVTGGPAAVIHAHGPYTTAVSCEQDLVLMQPIDEIGKEQIGKIIIVDPDPENPEEFLRQVAEALQQGGMRCVVVRGKGSYAVGADLDQAWANAAMLEHSMKIVMLARQANLKV
jgi:ribulose-5-phosphate 4-epimerase/fuculose-1-phosphate aldolase